MRYIYIYLLFKVLREMEIEYIVAPFEADAQLTFLEKRKLVDAVLTADSDLLAFGCFKVNCDIPVCIGL